MTDTLEADDDAIEPVRLPPSTRPPRRRPSALRSTIEWVVVLGGALVVALVIRAFLFATFWIPSASMHPELLENDRVVVNKLSYKLHDPHRGDIVVFSKPKSEADITENGRAVNDLIKRVVALPGETVTLRDGRVLIDGKALSEPYLPAGTTTNQICDFTSVTVPVKSVLVMGDNRGNSKDGRCFGPIKDSSIVGRAFVRIWPFSRLGGL